MSSEVISLGIGSPGNIEHFVLVGLNAVDDGGGGQQDNGRSLLLRYFWPGAYAPWVLAAVGLLTDLHKRFSI